MGVSYCPGMSLTGGTTRQGVWTGQVTIDKGAASGLWNIGVVLFDPANSVYQSVAYVGEDVAADWAASGNPTERELAGARFTVVGSAE